MSAKVKKLELLLGRVQERRRARPVVELEEIGGLGVASSHVAPASPGHIPGIGLSGAARSALDKSGLDERGAAALERPVELEEDALVASGLVLPTGEVHDRPTIQLGDDDEGDYEPPPRVERLLPELMPSDAAARAGGARAGGRSPGALEEKEEQPTLRISRKVFEDRIPGVPATAVQVEGAEEASGEQEETTGEHRARKTMIFGEEEETTGELSIAALSSSEETTGEHQAQPARPGIIEEDDGEGSIPTIAPPASEAAAAMSSLPRAPRAPVAPSPPPPSSRAKIEPEALFAPEPVEAPVVKARGVAPRPRPATFGELLSRTLALRPRADRGFET